MNIDELMAEDAEQGVGIPVPTDEDFASIRELVSQQLQLEEEVAMAEQALVDKKRDLDRVQKDLLPGALLRFGITKFNLVDGRSVEVDEEVRAGITAANLPAAIDYLVKTGNDDIIKNDVDLTFGKGQDEEAASLMQLLSTMGLSYKNKKYVHPQTLKAFVRGQLEQGTIPPTDIFSIYIDKVAKIKEPKKAKYKP